MNANSPAVLIPLMLSNEDALEEVQVLAGLLSHFA